MTFSNDYIDRYILAGTLEGKIDIFRSKKK